MSAVALMAAVATAQPVSTRVIRGFANPESVVGDGSRFFVSNLGAKTEPGAKDGDGFITEVSSDGKITNAKFLPLEGTLNAPKGLAVLGSTLYVTDIDRLVGFDMTSRKIVFELDMAKTGSSFLNDLAVLDDRTLLVSATDTGRVFRVDVTKKSFDDLGVSIPSVNGLTVDGPARRVYVVAFGGPAGVIDLSETPRYTALTSQQGSFDGIISLGARGYAVTDWGKLEGPGTSPSPGTVWLFVPESKSLQKLPVDQSMRGPADLFYDRASGTLWIPCMIDGTVVVTTIK